MKLYIVNELKYFDSKGVDLELGKGQLLMHALSEKGTVELLQYVLDKYTFDDVDIRVEVRRFLVDTDDKEKVRVLVENDAFMTKLESQSLGVSLELREFLKK